MKKKGIVGGVALLLVGVGALVYWGQYRRRSEALYYSGTIDVIMSDLAFQVSGRVLEVLVDEGHAVRARQKLAVLDPALFLAQKEKAGADLHRAEADLERLRARLAMDRRVLPAQVERARAAVSALAADLRALEAGYRSQEVEKARLGVDAAEAALDVARKEKKRYEALLLKKAVSQSAKDAVTLRFESAQKAYLRARESLKLAEEGYRREKIEAARSRLAEGKAALKVARSNLARLAVLEKEVKAARSRLEAAKSALKLAGIQLGYTELHAPFDGIVLSRNMEPGEVVTPGQEVLSVGDLFHVELKVFVDETEIGKVRPGQKVDVKVDTFPDKTYVGTVTHISPQAEFTPKIIQTQKERVKLVYRVKIAIPNPDLELKPGMPADAWFR